LEKKEEIAVENVVKIEDKDSGFSSNHRIHWSWILVLLLVCVVVIYMLSRLVSESLSFFHSYFKLFFRTQL